MCNVTLSHVSHDLFVCATIHMRHMAHSYVWHNSFVCGVLYTCDMYVWCDSFTCVAWLIRMWDTTRSCVGRVSFVRATDSFTCHVNYGRVGTQGSPHVYEMTVLYVWQDSFVYATWYIRVCDITHCVHDTTFRTCDVEASIWIRRLEYRITHS